MIRLCIFGSRDIVLNDQVIDAQLALMGLRESDIDEVVSGCSGDVDLSGERWAQKRGIPVAPFPAPWHERGNAAGPIRNRQMAEYCTHGLGFWRRDSRGTANMATHLLVLGRSVRVVEVPK